MKHQLKIIPLEERIVLDAALVATIVHTDSHQASSSASIIYVNINAAPGGNGTSWSQAYNNLQAALTAAANDKGPEQIWIAQGTYTPSQIYEPANSSSSSIQGGASGIRNSNMYTFNLPNNVELFGGFVGNETSVSQAKPLAHPTILSGDLLGNDSTDPSDPGYIASKADNAWHVITAGNNITDTGVTATLTGLTIIGGYAAGPDAYGLDSGAGLWARFGSHITLNNDLFLDNDAGVSSASNSPGPLPAGGGAIFASDSGTTITIGQNTQFLTNNAGDNFHTRSEGGAILVENGATVSISDANFIGNSSMNQGGAIAEINGGLLNVSGTFFLENQVVDNGAGGGAVFMQNTRGTLSNDQFLNNSAFFGGAVMLDSASGGISISHSQFQDNSATDGGALYALNANVTLTSNNFSGDSASNANEIYAKSSTINGISTASSSKLIQALKKSDKIDPFNDSDFNF